MSAVERYSVVTTGAIVPGFDQDQVAQAFVGLLHISREMADTFVTSKKCVASDLEEPRAMAYQESLKEIGLPVVIVPSDELNAAPANDDHHVSAEPIKSATAVDTDFVPTREIENDPYLEVSKPRKSKRVFYLAALGVITALAAGVFVLTNNPTTSNSTFDAIDSYLPEAKAGEQIETLLSVSGMNDDFANFPAFIQSAHVEYFDELKKRTPTLTDKKYNELMKLVPRAYNAEALKNAMGNRLQQNTFESDVIGLLKLFENPSVKQYVSLTLQRNPIANPEEFSIFKASLKRTPLPKRRYDAISDFISTLGLDKAAYGVSSNLQRNLITTAAELRPDRNTDASKKRVDNEIQNSRTGFSRLKPEIREELINTFAWQYAEIDTADIKELRNIMDRYLVRNYIRETSAGYENYLLKSTFWLHRKLGE